MPAFISSRSRPSLHFVCPNHRGWENERTRVENPDLNQWIGAAIAVVVGIAIATILRWVLRRLGRRRDSQHGSMAFLILARLIFVIVAAAGIYVALRIVGLDLGPVLAGAGIAGIAIAFALQDIAENYITGILMGLRSPFRVGDEISSGDHEGKVEEMNLRYTTIRNYDGVRVLLPNGTVLKNPITNFSVNGSRRSDFQIGVAYGTDLEGARNVVIEAVSALPAVDSEKPVQAWVEELAASWINIRIRYWHAPGKADVWEVRNAALIATVRATDNAGIDLPFERQILDVVPAPTNQ